LRPMVYPLHRDDTQAKIVVSPNLPELEEQVLAYWAADNTFAASVEKNPAGKDGSNEFVFYDGPPFANGLPHYGHLLTGYAKDVVPRYQTMRGKRVERRFGWDTHGLPAELDAMQQLGIKTKQEILDLGIEAFNAACRASVMKYTAEWQDYVTRQARWVDFENDYRTMNLPYMESVIWGFKQLWDRGLIYEGFRVLPYCWNDQTPLSNHELRMDDEVYQDRQDPAVTVGFRLTSGTVDGLVRPGDIALIWTTTPWTLPANLLITVGADIDYVVVESSKPTGHPERYILAKDRLPNYAKELTNDGVEDLADQIVATVKGRDLVGLTYQPPFNYYLGHENAFRVVSDDYVTTTDGTGIVHTAPAFGEDDKVTADREGVTAVLPIGPDGRFRAPVTDYEGVLVFDANPMVINNLKARTYFDADGAPGDFGAITPGTVLVKRESYTHSYPHCYRCKQPLIYMGVSSWFVEVTKIKERMLELNELIDWTPAHIKEGIFGKWLENARDWSITRNRFWGSPVPVWKSDDPNYPRIDVYGSLAELEADFGVEVTDLHRPFIDELTRPNPDDPTGKSTMRRVEDVMDVWVDSGSMPYAQVHYPFENQDWFEHHYPGDFIVEYIGQTRGWFYTLHVLATAIFDRPAFKSCVSHGIVLGDDGRKMSKSLRNYPDVAEVFERDGSDAMRWFLMASPILRGGNLIVTEEGIRDAVRQVLLPLWSTYYFFTLYANSTKAGGYTAKLIEPHRIVTLPVIDRYILAKTNDLIQLTTTQLDAYDIPGACESVRQFLDVLTNWYVRTQRDRFWEEDADAFDTLYTVLVTLCQVMAPLAPLLTEEIWRGLTGGRSVHLTDWPAPVPQADDVPLVAAMDEVRAVVSAALGLRKANQVRVRQPLSKLVVAVPEPTALADYLDLLKTELNVKDVELVAATADAASKFGIVERLAVNARAAGPRLGKAVQSAIKAAKSGAWRHETGPDGEVVVVETPDGDVPLEPSEYTLETVVEGGAGAGQSAASVLPGGGFVVLDLALTPELEAEGYARDVIRDVQDARKAAGLDVADRIALTLSIPADHVADVETHRDLISRETLATMLNVQATEGEKRQVALTKA